MEHARSADGLDIAFNRRGEGTGDPLLVFPGGPSRDPAYLGDLAGLDRHRSLVIIHPRGTPATGSLSRGWWSDAADVIAVADHLGLRAFDVLAHSAGTRLALAAAVQHRSRIRSLLLVTPPASWLTQAEDDTEGWEVREDQRALARARESMRAPFPEDEESFQRTWAAQAPAGYARWNDVARRHARVGSVPRAAVLAWFEAIPADAPAQIRNTTMPPALVIAGARDWLTGLLPVAAYASALRARLAVIRDSGHYPWIEQPETFLRSVAGRSPDVREMRR